MRQAIIYIVISFFIMGWLEKMPLPSDINSNSEFVAGDSTYLLVNPIWDVTYGFVSPIEISIAPDGHVGIPPEYLVVTSADPGHPCIISRDEFGLLVTKLFTADRIVKPDGDPPPPHY